MKIVHVETLISRGAFSRSQTWRQIRRQVHAGIKNLCWPTGAKKFTINPQSGKKRGEGNGVKPLKEGLMVELSDVGWKREQAIDLATAKRPGKVDAMLATTPL